MAVLVIFFLGAVALAIGLSRARQSKATAIKKPSPPRKIVVPIETFVARGHAHLQTREDEEFERRLEPHIADITDKRFYAKVSGISFPNPDGEARSGLVAKCQMFQELGLLREPDNPYSANAVAVITAEGKKLGYLQSEVGSQISREMDRDHRRWTAFVRKVTPPNGDYKMGMVIYLLRLTPAFVEMKLAEKK